MRFKEIRLIKDKNKVQYQLLVGGFVFYNHGCFFLLGSSIETPPGVTERQLRKSDIRHVQLAYYVLDDDEDAEIVRGIKVTGLRYARDPAAAVLHLERLSNSEIDVTNWHTVYEYPEIDIGMYDVSNTSSPKAQKLREYQNLLEPVSDENYRMVSVGRWFD
ncbi:MAG: hypothetical protein AAF683_10195 [Pseudomonadota bacterium]